jgi:hypothetical protein
MNELNEYNINILVFLLLLNEKSIFSKEKQKRYCQHKQKQKLGKFLKNCFVEQTK